jgi:hypothetical protein
MQKMFLLVTGLACVCAPSQGFTQVSKMERPNAITGIGASNLQTGVNPGKLGLANTSLQNTGYAGKLEKLDQRNRQTGAKLGKLDASSANLQDSGNFDKLKNADPRSGQTGAKPGKLEQVNTRLQNDAKSTEQLGAKLDAKSDMSMEKQQRLQMYMERYDKSMEQLSNTLRKESETSGNITKNMK